MADNVNVTTLVDITLGKTSLKQMAAKGPIAVQQPGVHVRVALDDEMKALIAPLVEVKDAEPDSDPD